MLGLTDYDSAGASSDASPAVGATEAGAAALLGYLYRGEVSELGGAGQLSGGEWNDGGGGGIDPAATTAAEAPTEQTVELACELLQLADHFLLPRLKEICEVYLAKDTVVDINNVCALLTHAVGCNAHQLVQICRFYIVSMREMVTKMEQWAELPDEIKAMIV